MKVQRKSRAFIIALSLTGALACDKSRAPDQASAETSEAQKEAQPAPQESSALSEEREKLITEARTKLEEMERRAATLKVKAKDAAAETEQQVSQALSTFPEQRKVIAHDIQAIREVAAANFERAKIVLHNKLAALDERLDRAASYE